MDRLLQALDEVDDFVTALRQILVAYGWNIGMREPRRVAVSDEHRGSPAGQREWKPNLSTRIASPAAT